jgi:hypothetical protein
MYYKFSRLAKGLILFNVFITILVLMFHFYNVHRINDTQAQIVEKMQEQGVTRKTAIYMLQHEGVELYLNKEFGTYFGICASMLTLLLSYKFGKHNGFMYGIGLGLASTLTTLVGGVLLFGLLFSGKSETDNRKIKINQKDSWEDYIHRKSTRG